MVRKEPDADARIRPESLPEALDAPIRSWSAVRDAASEPVYLVGGAVRDLLLGRGRADLDLVVEGDAAALAERARAPRWSSTSASPPRRCELDGHEVDIASRAHRVLPAAGRAARGRAGRRHRGRPRPPRLHDQRDGDPAARRAAS